MREFGVNSLSPPDQRKRVPRVTRSQYRVLRVLDLSQGDMYLVATAEGMLGAERAQWTLMKRFAQAKLSGRVSSDLSDSAMRAVDHHQVSRFSAATAFRRSETTDSLRLAELANARRIRDHTRSHARRTTRFAYFAFPVSLVCVLVLYSFARSGNWRLPLDATRPERVA